jgi:hypothetical protein
MTAADRFDRTPSPFAELAFVGVVFALLMFAVLVRPFRPLYPEVPSCE